MDVSVYSPISLPNDGDTFVGRQGLVYGEQPLATKKRELQFAQFKVGEAMASIQPLWTI